jgi:hypothetical protein
MAEYIKLPDGSFLELKEGQSALEGRMAAQQLYPELFKTESETPKQDTSGLKAAASAGLTRLGGEFELLKGKAGFKDQAEAQREYEAAEKKASERFTPTEKGWSEDPFLKFRETLGGSLPSMVAPAAAGLAALALPVSAPVAIGAGLLGAGAVSAGQFTGSNLSRQVGTGKSLEEASGAAALGAAIPQALIDTAAMALIPGVGKLFGSVGSKLTTEQAKAIASQTLGKAAADYTAKTGLAMGREGFTEVVQQSLERLQAGLNIADPDAREEYIESFIGGAVLGGAIAPVGRAIERSGAKTQAARAERDERNVAAKEAAEQERLAKEQQTAAEKQQAAQEEAERNSAPYAMQVGQQYDALLADFNARKAALKKPGKDATPVEKAEYKDAQKELQDLNAQLKEIVPEYRRTAPIRAQAQEQARVEGLSPEEFMLEQTMGGEGMQAAGRARGERGALFGRDQLPAAPVDTSVQDYVNARVELAREQLTAPTGMELVEYLAQDPVMAARIVETKTPMPGMSYSESNLLRNALGKTLAAQAKAQAKAQEEARTAQAEQAERIQAAMAGQTPGSEIMGAMREQPGVRAAQEERATDEARLAKIAPEISALRRISENPLGISGLSDQFRLFGEAQTPPSPGIAPIGQMRQKLLGEDVTFTAEEEKKRDLRRVPGADFKLRARAEGTGAPVTRDELADRINTVLSTYDLSPEAVELLQRVEKAMPQKLAPEYAQMLDQQLGLIESSQEGVPRKGADRPAMLQAFPAAGARADTAAPTTAFKYEQESLRSAQQGQAQTTGRRVTQPEGERVTVETGETPVQKRVSDITPKTLRGESAAPAPLSALTADRNKEQSPLVEFLRIAEAAAAEDAGQMDLFDKKAEVARQRAATKEGKPVGVPLGRGTIKESPEAFRRVQDAPTARKVRKDLREAEAAKKPQTAAEKARAEQGAKDAELLQYKRDLSDARAKFLNDVLGAQARLREQVPGRIVRALSEIERDAREKGLTADAAQGIQYKNALYNKDAGWLLREIGKVEKTLREITEKVTAAKNKSASYTGDIAMVKAFKGQASAIRAHSRLSVQLAALNNAYELRSGAAQPRVTSALRVEDKERARPEEQEEIDAELERVQTFGIRKERVNTLKEQLAAAKKDGTEKSVRRLSEELRKAENELAEVAPKQIKGKVTQASRIESSAPSKLRAGTEESKKTTGSVKRPVVEGRTEKLPTVKQAVDAGNLASLLKQAAEKPKTAAEIKALSMEQDRVVTEAQQKLVDDLRIQKNKLEEEVRALTNLQAKGTTRVTAETLKTKSKQLQQVSNAFNRANTTLKRYYNATVGGTGVSDVEGPDMRGSTSRSSKAIDDDQEGLSYLRGVETESLALNRDVVALLEKGDVQGALLLISKDPAVDKFSQAVAARLAPFLDVTKVQLVNKLTDPDGKEVLGAATSKLIELNRNGGLSVETLLHEATHAAAERVVQLSETNPNALTKEQKLAVNELKALHARVKNDKGITSKNAKSSLSEFVAEAMSNRNLQKQLAQRQWRLVDAWKGIKSIIMRMLGMQKVETMFGASVVAVDQLFVPASAKVGKGRKETRVTRSLSAKDIAALDDGSNSMKQFADQFGPLIKQKDRTPEDVERIGAQVIDDMLNSALPYIKPSGLMSKSEVAKLRAEHNAKSVVALPTADSLDYKGMVTMSDGKTYDENNPLHYVEATPATFAALEAMNNPDLREREAETIASQRQTDFLNLASYLVGNYKNYTTAETALVLKAAAKYGVISGSNGRLKLVEIGKDNRHNIAVLGKETADAVIEQLRAGKGLKQAFLDGLQKNADDNAKNNERKNGWKKFEQGGSPGAALQTLYTEDEINRALNKTGYDGAEFNTEAELIEQLIADGHLKDRRSKTSVDALEKAAIELNEGCAGTPWCTGASVGTARNQIEQGDFYVYYDKGRPEVAVRMDGNSKIGEVRGNNPNQALNPAQQDLAANFLRSNKFEKADEYLSEFERREALVKLAKGETKLGVNDLLGEESPLNSRGKVDAFSVGQLLTFRNIDGYRNRPDPVDSVVDFFGKQYFDAAVRAYENNQFVFSDVRVNENTEKEGVEVEFAGNKYNATTDTLKAAKEITLTAFSYGRKRAAAVTFPKLTDVKELTIFYGELVLPALETVNEVTFFRREKTGPQAKIVMPPNAVVKEVRGHADAAGVIEGPTTVELVTLSRSTGSLVLELPDTKYVATVVDDRGIARRYAAEAIEPTNEALETKGIGFADQRRAKRGEATPEQNATYAAVAGLAHKKFFDALKKIFGTAAYQHALKNTDTYEAYTKTNDYRTAIRNAVEDVLERYKYSREAFDKMAEVIANSTGAKVAYEEGQLIAPKRVGNPPSGAEFTEAPEERRFLRAAPADAAADADALESLSKKIIAQPKTLKEKLGSNLALQLEMQGVDMRAGLRDTLKFGDDKLFTQAMYHVRKAEQKMAQMFTVMNSGPLVAYKDSKGLTGYRSSNQNSAREVFDAISDIPVDNPQLKTDLAQTYLVAVRANNKGLPKLDLGAMELKQADLDAALAAAEANPALKSALENVRRKYSAYNKGMIEFLASTQRITKKEAADLLKEGDYVPFYRVDKNGKADLVFNNNVKFNVGDIRRQPYLAELKGGDTKLLPLNEAIQRNTLLLTDMALTNNAAKSVAYGLQALGKGAGPVDPKTGKPTNLMAIKPGFGPDDASVVRFYQEPDPRDPEDDGKRHILVDTTGTLAEGIPAELVVQSLEGASLALPGFFKLGGIAADWLRAGVTRTPLYIARKLVREPMAASFTGGLESNAFSSVFKAGAEFLRMSAGSSDAQAKLVEKGLIQSNIFAGDMSDMKKMALQLASGKDQSAWEKVFAAADRYAMRADAATLALVLKNAEASGLSEVEADMATMESMNFYKRGLSPTLQYASRLIPFFNAQIQGLNVLVKAARGNMPFEEQQEIKRKFLNNALLLTFTGVAYAMAMEDDETFRNARPRDKYSNFFMPIPGVDEPLKLPIPFEAGYFFSLAVAAVDSMRAETDGKAQWQAIRDLFLGSVPGYSSMFVPQIVKPAFEVWSNKNFLTGGAVESLRFQGLDTEARYLATTTELAKQMSKAVPLLSPIQIEHIVRGYFGVMPLAAVAAANNLFAREDKGEKPAGRASDLPLVGTAFQKKYGGADADVVFREVDEILQTRNTFNDILKSGRREEAVEYRDKHRVELAMASAAGQYRQVIGRINADVRRTQERNDLTPEEKRLRLDELDKARQGRAEAFIKMQRAIEARQGTD